MSEPSRAESNACDTPACRLCKPAIGVLLLAVVLVGWIVYAKMTGHGPPPRETPPPPVSAPLPQPDRQPEEAPAVEDETEDERFRRLVVGTWEDDYQGHRTMTLAADGTGRMVVELEGLKATLFAARLRFDMQWSVESGHLEKKTIGGEPSTQVQMILKTMGDRVNEPILELTDQRLLLLDKDGKTKYDWRRVEPEK